MPPEAAAPPEAAGAPEAASVPFEPATPEGWAPTEPPEAQSTAAPARSSGRKASRATLLAGIALAAFVGVGAVGLAASLQDGVGDTATVGAPQGTNPSAGGGRPGRGGAGDDGQGRDGQGRGDMGNGGRHGGMGDGGMGRGRHGDGTGDGGHGGRGFQGQQDAPTSAPDDGSQDGASG
jgi:hypothetical protein